MSLAAPAKWVSPEEAITDDILAQVKKGVEWGLECWSEVVKEAINMALKG